MCLGAPKLPETQPFVPPPAPEAPPPPSATAKTVTQSGAANPFVAAPAKKKNPFRIDKSPTYDSGSPDSVATGLNIPV